MNLILLWVSHHQAIHIMKTVLELYSFKAGQILISGFPQIRTYTTQPTRFAKQFDTLISVRAPVGDMNMAYEDCCIGRGLSAFRYKHSDKYYSYTYYKLRSFTSKR